MGEWSKKIGEQGEDIVKYFFEELIGYRNSYRTNISIDCNHSDDHKKKGSDKRLTHGVDGLVSYKSPLFDELLEIGIISSKYTFDKYPNKPKETFKDFFVELAFTIKCFLHSPNYREINSSTSNVSDTTITGVLFYLSNNEESRSQDLVQEIADTSFQSYNLAYDKILVVDNSRMEFLFNLIQPIKNGFGNDNYEFIYPKTGMNNSMTQNNSFGKKLPLQYLCSNIIPIRIKEGNNTILLIGTRDKFDENDLLKIIGLSKEFNHLEATTKTIISFPDYNKLTHSETVKKVLAQLESVDYSDQIEVVKHDFDFRNV